MALKDVFGKMPDFPLPQVERKRVFNEIADILDQRIGLTEKEYAHYKVEYQLSGDFSKITLILSPKEEKDNAKDS